MLGHIYYFIGLFIFFSSLSKTIIYWRLVDTKNWIQKFKKVTGKTPNKEDFRTKEEYNIFLSYGIVSIFEIIWIITGIISQNWKVFAFIIIIGFLIKQINDFTPVPVQKIIGTAFSILKTILILALVLNHFHFHQDLMDILMSFL